MAGQPPHNAVPIFGHLERLRSRADRDMATLMVSIPGMRGSFGRILTTLPPEGARSTVIAEGMGISKQAVGERLRELERRGWVTSTPDPTDGRARIIRRTKAGDRVRRETLAGIAQMEAAWAEQVGRERYELFLEIIAELGAGADVDAAGGGDGSEDGDSDGSSLD